jgi:hypothetical protein
MKSHGLLLCLLLLLTIPGSSAVVNKAAPDFLYPPNIPLTKIPKAFTPPVPGAVYLVWDYPEPLPQNNIIFKIYHSTDLKSWSFLTTISKPPLQLVPSGAEFFVVYTYDLNTDLYSDLNPIPSFALGDWQGTIGLDWDRGGLRLGDA